MALSAFVASPSLSASPIRVVNFCCYANLITCRHASTSPLLVQCWTTSISGAHNYVCNLGSGATQGRNVKVALVPRRGWLMRVRVVAPTHPQPAWATPMVRVSLSVGQRAHLQSVEATPQEKREKDPFLLPFPTSQETDNKCRSLSKR